MVGIAGLIGAQALGSEVQQSLQHADNGRGLLAGITLLLRHGGPDCARQFPPQAM